MTVLTRGGDPPQTPPGHGGAARPPVPPRPPVTPPGLLAALETVRDPELDEPITSLGFVASCTVSADGDAEVRL
ncbi:MAG TPA: iron-sulfur cluster assembly protein, partial [Streptosporangiaceae bacterium]|nr:iron-sulfur cluster assembly protein [Streptosporangiaceae bacterium]